MSYFKEDDAFVDNILDSKIDLDKYDSSEEDEEFVPIYGIIKQYSEDKYRNDGTLKSDDELSSVMFHKHIKTLTRGDNYSHALVSFDDSFTRMYSFADDGFEIDNIMENDSWMGTGTIYVCVMFVKMSDKQRMERYVNDLNAHRDDSKYAWSNLIKAYVSRPAKIDKRFVCSSFTGFILQCSNPKNLHRDYSRLRPEDITILPRAFYVMNFKDREDFIKNKSSFKERVKGIYDEFHEEIEDYNNHLPKLLLKERISKLKTFDKIFDWISYRIYNN